MSFALAVDVILAGLTADVFWVGSSCILGWILMYSWLDLHVFSAESSCILGWNFMYSGLAADIFWTDS